MKIVMAALLGLLGSAQAFGLCPAKEDKVSCFVFATKGGQRIYENNSISFSVFESTFLCDGRSNRFYYKEFDMKGTPLKVGIYGNWDSFRLALYDQNDHGGMNGTGADAMAQGWFNRGGLDNNTSKLEATSDQVKYFVSCQTDSTGLE